ncbi:porin [Alteromonas sp. a30]|uniref:porin n=1 Tax=Alteromonas sp. a30 TaxID=2730917 RepID=UPI002282E513|nr:porin [Alteromonas sp. a30]MCY7297369.1 porin [Alteromonas sp. a30]
MKYISACLLALCSSVSLASDFKVSGFGTLSAVKTNNADVEFIQNNRLPDGASDDWEFDNDTVLGLQGQYKINDEWSTVLQLLSRRNENNNFDPQIDWAYIKYSPKPNLSFRLGRFISPVFLSSDNRNVNFSNIWVRPPIDIYSQATINNIDGIDVTYRGYIGDFDYKIQAYLGGYTLDFPSGGDIKFHHMAGLVGTLSYDAWTFRLAYMDADHSSRNAEGIIPDPNLFMVVTADGLGYTVNPDESCLFADEGVTCGDVITNLRDNMDYVKRSHRPFDLANAAVVYDDGKYFAQGEFMYRHSASVLSNAIGAYMTLGMRIGEFSPYVSYSFGKTLKETKYFELTPEYKAAVDAGVEASGLLQTDRFQVSEYSFTSNKQNTITAGVRYDFAPNMALKLQVDKFRPLEHDGRGNNGSGLLVDGPLLSTQNRNVYVTTVSFDFIF